MDSTPHHLMYHLLAPGYDQVQWNTPYLDNTKAAIDSTNPVIALNSANPTTTADGPIVLPPSSIYCPLPVKYEQPLQSYDDTGGYSITALGASAGPSAADQQQQLLYGAPTTGNNHPPDPQQLSMSALNFFTGQTGGAYPATPAALMGPLMNAAGGGDNPDSEQLNKQKELIYGHPLFPMLTVLFQKCELATCTPREPAKEGDQIDLMNVCSAASFTQDLEEFAKTVQMNKPYYLPNPELDSLMINAIQVLRYHLLELEKVHELCDNFCAKYVNKIKERTQMDIIAGEQPPPSSIDQPNPQSATPNRSQPTTGMGSLSSPATSSSMEHQMQHYGTPGPHQQYAGQELMSQHQLSEQQSNSACSQQLGFLDAAAAASSAMGMNNAMMLEQQAAIQQFYAHQQQHQQQQQMALNGASQLKQEMVSNGGGGGNARHAKRAKKSANTTAHIHAQPHQPENHPSPDTTARTDSNGGSRSSTATATAAVGEDTKNSIVSNGMLSSATQITNAQQTATPQPHQQQQQNNLDALDETGGDDGLSFGDMSEERDSASPDSEHNKSHHRGENGSQKKKVPKVFSKEAISKFRAWLFNNITHPYPAEEQKKQLAAETGLTILQVNNWFINARRRIVQPMIDSNNRAGRPMSVFKNRRRKSSGGNGTTPSPQPDCQSPELANGTIANGSAGMLNTSSSPDESSTDANSAANNSGGSSSSTGGGANGLGIQPVVDPLLNFSAGSSMAVTNQYQAAAAVAAAVSSNHYANFGGAFPFSTAGMGGMSAMMPYGLNSMPGASWSAMDLGGRSGMDR